MAAAPGLCWATDVLRPTLPTPGRGGCVKGPTQAPRPWGRRPSPVTLIRLQCPPHVAGPRPLAVLRVFREPKPAPSYSSKPAAPSPGGSGTDSESRSTPASAREEGRWEGLSCSVDAGLSASISTASRPPAHDRRLVWEGRLGPRSCGHHSQAGGVRLQQPVGGHAAGPMQAGMQAWRPVWGRGRGACRRL